MTLDVQTSGLQSAGYTDIVFQLFADDDFSHADSSKPGLVVLPGQTVNQTVSAATDYKVDAVVWGSQSPDIAGTRWNVSVTGPHLPTLDLKGSKIQNSTDYGYATSAITAGPMFGVVQIPNNVQTFDAGKALKINAYQINDTSGQPITTVPFSAFITADSEDLTNFDFWDANHNKLTKISSELVGDLTWIDSDATGKFTFYITCNASSAYSDTLTLNVGNQSPQIALIVAADPATLGISSILPAPKPSNVLGSDLNLSDQDTSVFIDIPKAVFPNVFQANDILILVVNGKVQPNTATAVVAGYTTLPFKNFFNVSASDLNVSPDGASNTLQYINVRDGETSLSSEFPFIAIGNSQSGPSPQPPTRKYLMPEIVGNPGYLEIEYEDVVNGLTVKIDWSGANWAPNLNDVLKLTIQFNGWNWDGTTNTSAPVISFDPVASGDLQNKYIQKTIEYRYFAGLIEDPSTGAKSKLFMQYYVPASGNNQAGWSQSTPLIDIDTVPPGGL
ncbi:hypothetical protein PPNSA23_47010 [Phyllobacterium phragmitis]|uniref:Uncharacterized protein n=1 Tax=Phyllobacterium phragmitis TaxID=2670329 RepID=A0ABQ0H757_9HYPH